MHVGMHDPASESDPELVAIAVEMFAMLADATRLRIVLALANSAELSVNAIAELVEKPSPAVSQHLAKLRLARMVTTRHEGTKIFYRLVDEHASALVHGALSQAEHVVANGAPPRHHDGEGEAS